MVDEQPYDLLIFIFLKVQLTKTQGRFGLLVIIASIWPEAVSKSYNNHDLHEIYSSYCFESLEV